MVLRFWLVFGLTCGMAAADSANGYFDKALRNAIPNPFIDKHDSPKFEIPKFGQDYQWRSKIAQVNTATGRCAIRLTEARRPGNQNFAITVFPPSESLDRMAAPAGLRACKK